MPGFVTNAAATAFSNQRKLDRASNGNLLSMVSVSGSTGRFYLSTDGGVAWTQLSMDILGVANGSIFIDADDYLHVVWKQTGTGGARTDGYIYYMRGTPNAGRTSWTFSAALTASNNTNDNYPDVVAHREGTGWMVHVVQSYADGAGNVTGYWRISASSAGDITTALAPAAISANYSVPAPGGHTFPSIDFNHTGDGKTVAGGTPHLYVGWSAGKTGAGFGIRFRKAVYSAGSWTWNAEREIDPNLYLDGPPFRAGLSCLFDGTRVIVGGTFRDANHNFGGTLYERDAADTTTTTLRRVSQDNIATETMTYDQSGNVYFIGQSGGAQPVRKYTRATSAFATLFSNTLVPDAPAFGAPTAKRGHIGSRIEWLWTHGNNSPYSVKYDFIGLNVAPNAPTLTAPANNTIFDRATAQRFTWNFSDPDGGDSQSKYDLQYRLVGGTTWTTVTGTTPNTFHDFAGGAFAAGDYEWQVRTYDAQGLVGPYSASNFFTAANAPSAPTITDPPNNATIGTSEYLLQWSYPTQAAFQVRKVADLNGSPDTATIYFDTGVVESTTARSRNLTFPENGRTEHLQVRIRDTNGLWSPYATVKVLVSYTPPTPSTLTLTPDPAIAAIRASIYNQPPNLLPNDAASSFEDGTLGGWGGGPTRANTTEQAFHGTRSLKVTDATTDAAAGNLIVHTVGGPAGAVIPVTAGGTYTASAYVRPATTARSARSIIEWWKDNGDGTRTMTGTAAAGAFVTESATGWVRLVATGVAPAGTTYIVVLVQWTDVADGESHYLDAAQVEQGSTATPFHLPSVPKVNENWLYRRKSGAWERIAVLPVNGSFVDYTPPSDTTMEYYVSARGANGTAQDSSVYSSKVKFKGTWLLDPRDPAGTLHQFLWDGMGRSTQWEPESFLQKFVGRKYPVVEFGEAEEFTISMNLALDDETGDRQAMGVLQTRKGVLLYRDGRGRKAFVHIPRYPVEDTVYGQMLNLNATQVDYSEAV